MPNRLETEYRNITAELNNTNQQLEADFERKQAEEAVQESETFCCGGVR